MARRFYRRAMWRLLAALSLVTLFMQTPIPVALAEGSLVVAVTDESGTPLAGADVAMYEAVPAPENTDVQEGDEPGLVPGPEPVAGPLTTGSDGLATFSDLPEGTPLFVVQTSAPVGYLPASEPVEVTVEASSAEEPLRVDLVASVALGVVEVIVAGAGSGAPLEGATIAAYTLPDPASGLRGSFVGEAVSGPEGIARFDLPVGTYIIAITAPAPGFIAPGPVADQPITVSMPLDGQRDYQTVVFEMLPTPPPENIPAPEPPTVTPEPPTPEPPTEAPIPTATTEPTVVPAPEDAVISVAGLICTSAFQFNTVAYYRVGVDGPAESFRDNQVPDCRLAAEGELTFTLTDPASEEVFDDEIVATAAADAGGTATIAIPVPESGRVLLLGLEESIRASTPFTVMPGDMISLVIVKYVLPPAGNLVVRSVDAETSTIAAGGCLQLIPSTGDDQPYESCDADDGATDGRTRFIDIPNGDYTLRQTEAALGFAPVPDQTIQIQGRSVDMAISADALGAIEVRARSCTETEAPIALSVEEPVRRAASDDGTGIGIGISVATPFADGCEPVATEVIIVPSSGEPMSVITGDDGRAVPVPLVPTGDEGAPHIVEVPGTDISVAADVRPGAVTIVTVTLSDDR
ncbi:MAG TPA: prealbumin-like fold domain-containing protein [Thermomicrobiales bacterium]|nr:prealbumin-like fold domain-containing protein [Thermomicrobiales bacterium]